MTSPLPLLAVGGILLYLAWQHTATRSIWLAVNVLDTYRALRAVRPNGRRMGVQTRRKAMRSSLVCWVIYVLGTTASPFMTTLFGWLPLFATVKAVVCTCFLLTRLSSSTSLYNLITPFIKPYETPIDLTVQLVEALAQLVLHYGVALPLRAVCLGPVGNAVGWSWRLGRGVVRWGGDEGSVENVEATEGKRKGWLTPGKPGGPVLGTGKGKKTLAAPSANADPSTLFSPGPPIPGALLPRRPLSTIQPVRAKAKPQPRPAVAAVAASQLAPPFPTFPTLPSTLINPVIIPPSPSPSPPPSPPSILSRAGPSRSQNAEAGPSTPSRAPGQGLYPDISTVKKGMLDVEREMEVRRSPRRNKGVRMGDALSELGGRSAGQDAEEGLVEKKQDKRGAKRAAVEVEDTAGGGEGRRNLGAPARSRTSAHLAVGTAASVKGKGKEKQDALSGGVAPLQKLPRGATTSNLAAVRGPSGTVPARSVVSGSRETLQPRLPPSTSTSALAPTSTSTNPLKQPPSRALPRSTTLPSRSRGLPSLPPIPAIPTKPPTTRTKPAPKPPRVVKPDPNGVGVEKPASTAASRARAARAAEKEKEKGVTAGDKRGAGAVTGEGSNGGAGEGVTIRRKRAKRCTTVCVVYVIAYD
ncbi:hypothetical protein IAT38_007320 [Cryptococcus sp. DSM 104549]